MNKILMTNKIHSRALSALKRAAFLSIAVCFSLSISACSSAAPTASKAESNGFDKPEDAFKTYIDGQSKGESKCYD